MTLKSWTDSQKNAIYSRGGALVVSASAGSGKTSVLVERIISRVTDREDPTDIDRILCMTFSSAAADEIKVRVRTRLSEMLEENPSDQFISRQLLLLDNAQISTVHSFCLNLIRENFEKLGISPDNRVLDESELALLKSEALSEVLENYYSAASPAFTELAGMMSSFRNDSELAGTVLKLHDFMRSHPFYELWLHKMTDLYSTRVPFAESEWGKRLFAHAEAIAETLENYIFDGKALLDGCDEKIYNSFAPLFEFFTASCDKIGKDIGNKDWVAFFGFIHSLKIPTRSQVRGEHDAELKELLESDVKKIKEAFDELKELAVSDTKTYNDDVTVLRPVIEELFALVLGFDEILAEKKREQGVMDFADMEHFALSLLFDTSAPPPYPPSPLAKELSGRFDEILVDEYQDTNETQDMIFSAVSRQGENVFIVGDVKQSIYRFRQAMPEIFSEKIRSAHSFGDGFPAKIFLKENFRSHKDVLACANFIFSSLMSRKLGEIDYNDDEALICGTEFPDETVSGVSLDIIECDGEAEDAPEKEAVFVAGKIKELLSSSALVPAEKGLRRVNPGDIAILLRSPGKHGEQSGYFLKALKDAGIPVSAANSDTFLTSPEVSAAVSALKAIVNPLSDIHMTAALLSDIFSLTPDDLAKMRTEKPKEPIYLALRSLAQKGVEPFSRVYGDFSRLRSIYPTLSCGAFIRRMYDFTSYFAAVSGGEAGAVRTANLNLLVNYADKYDAKSSRRLEGFLRYLSRLEEEGRDLPAASPSADSENVRIMSIHSSKGLEFPIVFLCDTARKFNMKDAQNHNLLHSSLGFSCMRSGSSGTVKFDTLMHRAMKAELENASLSEEMRMLYVAMTRAKSRLFITAHTKNAEKKLSAIAAKPGTSASISPYAVKKANSFFEWIVYALLRHPDGEALQKLSGAKPQMLPPHESHWKINISDAQASSVETLLSSPALSDASITGKISELAAFSYRYSAFSGVPSKISVSELSKKLSPDDESLLFSKTPSFLSKTGFSPAQRGSLTHRFMQLMDLKGAKISPEKELIRLRDEGFFRDDEADAVNISDVKKFIASKLFGRMLASDEVLREYKLLFSLPSERLGFPAGETVVTQGIADCVFKENGGLVLVDYKTDRVSSPDELVKRYQRQLTLYAEALSSALSAPVKEMLIYSFALGKEIALPLL